MRFVVTDKAEADLKNIFDFYCKGQPSNGSSLH